MRNSLAVTLLLMPAAVAGQSPRLDAADSDPRIVVTATRTARLTPDRATLYITVEGAGESPAEAAQRGTQRLQAVMSALQPFLRGTQSASTTPYGVALAPNIPGFPGAGSQASYLARYVVRAEPRSLDQISPLSAAVLTAGAGAVSPPTFEASGADSVRRLRYAEALTLARRDAESLAAALGGKLGAILEVSSGAAPRQGENAGFFGFMSRYDFQGPNQPPDVLVTATVTIRYRFIP